MSAANRKRGQRAEVAVVNYLRDQGWPDARRYLSGDGRQPGDIDWHPLVCLEVKDVATSAWPSWCRQALEESPRGTIPAVVRRTRGVPDVGLWPVRYWWGAWLRVIGPNAPAVPLPRRIVSTDGGDTSWYETTMAAFTAAIYGVDAPDVQAGER